MKHLAHTYQLLPLLELPALETEVLWLLCILFSGIALVYLFIIFRLRNRISSRSKTILEQKRMLAPMISTFLFYEQQADKEEQEDYIRMKIEIRELLRIRLNREVITEVLMDLKMDLSGEARSKLFELFINLKLHHEAFEMLKSRRWERISKGINQLAEMQVAEAYVFIRKFINHRKGTIRQQAQLATVSLKEEGIEYFLDKARYQISEWHQLKLLEILRQKPDYIPPKFHNWLTSENKDVVLFSLRLIRHYRQSEAEDSIITLLRHRSETIKYAALECIRDFGFIKARPQLKLLFKRSGEELKLLILDVLSKVGSIEDVVFLKEQAAKDRNFVVRSKALSAVNAIIPGAILPRKDLEKEFAQPGEGTMADITPSKAELEDTRREEAKASDEAPRQEETAPLPEKDSGVATADESVPETENIIQSRQGDTEQKEMESNTAGEAIQSPQPWDIEDETIFDQCFLEELHDILSSPENDPNQGILPLDFLPLVTHNINPIPMKSSKRPENSDHLMEIEVLDPLVVVPENYNEQLRAALSEDYPELGEIFDLNFIPWVTNTMEETPEETSAGEVGLPAGMDSGEAAEESADEVEIRADLPREDLPETAFPDSGDEAQSEGVLPELDATEALSAEVITAPAGETPQTNWVSETPETPEGLDEESAAASLIIQENTLAEGELPEEEQTEAEMPQFSIFQEYFRNYDTESKLIMLDEIPAIGEHKELLFLQTLFEDPNPKIARKAKEVSRQLHKNLVAQAQPEVKSSVTNEDQTLPNIEKKGVGSSEIFSRNRANPRNFRSPGHLDFTPHFDQTTSVSSTGENIPESKPRRRKKRLEKNINWPLI